MLCSSNKKKQSFFEKKDQKTFARLPVQSRFLCASASRRGDTAGCYGLRGSWLATAKRPSDDAVFEKPQ
jgi:hypothetical protein